MDTKSTLITIGIAAAFLAAAELSPQLSKVYAKHCDTIRERPLLLNAASGLRNIEDVSSAEQLLFPKCRPQIDRQIIPNNYVSPPYTEPYHDMSSYRLIKPKHKK